MVLSFAFEHNAGAIMHVLAMTVKQWMLGHQKMRIKIIVFAFAAMIGGANSAFASVWLPPPDLVVDGVPMASNPVVFGDDFVTYSSRILVEMQSRYPGQLPTALYGDFQSAQQGAGVGGQDLVIYTQSGVSNPDGIDNPLAAAAGDTESFTGTWGDNVGQGADGGATVGQVLSFLPHGSTIPVFAFDHNETGQAGDTLEINGYVAIFRGGFEIERWNFDALFNGDWDPDELITSPDTIDVTPDSSAPFTVDNNQGSGAVDFWGYAPDMDLSNFLATDQFRVFMQLEDLDNGGEELFISGSVGVRAIPEPATIAIWSCLGIGGLLFGNRFRRRRV